MYKDTEIILEKPSIVIKEDSTILFGLAGVGLIGPIIANTIIDQIDDMNYIGFIASKHLPPISVFYDGVLKHPFRIYYSQQYNLFMIVCEVPMEVSSAYNDLSDAICKWALSNEINAKEIIVFQGILRREMKEEYPVYYASEHKQSLIYEKNGVEKIQQGIITGPEATFLNQALTNKIDAHALFTPVSQYPTPEAAAAIIHVLNKVYELPIDTSKLIEEGKKIKKKMAELAEKTQTAQKRLAGGPSGHAPQIYR